MANMKSREKETRIATTCSMFPQRAIAIVERESSTIISKKVTLTLENAPCAGSFNNTATAIAKCTNGTPQSSLGRMFSNPNTPFFFFSAGEKMYKKPPKKFSQHHRDHASGAKKVPQWPRFCFLVCCFYPVLLRTCLTVFSLSLEGDRTRSRLRAGVRIRYECVCVSEAGSLTIPSLAPSSRKHPRVI